MGGGLALCIGSAPRCHVPMALCLHLQRTMDTIKAEQVRSVTAGVGLQAHGCCRARSLPDDPLPPRSTAVCVFLPGLNHTLRTSVHRSPLKTFRFSLRVLESLILQAGCLQHLTSQPNCAPNLAENFQVGEPSMITLPLILHVTKQRPGKSKSCLKAWLGQNADLLSPRGGSAVPQFFQLGVTWGYQPRWS